MLLETPLKIIRAYPDRIPDWISNAFPSYKWHESREERTIYLSFDDGPTPEVTEFVIQELAKYQFLGTFFCIGDKVHSYPNLYERLLKDGHRVGNHTYNHWNAFKCRKKDYINNVAHCSQIVTSKLFRPPYGRISRGIANELKKKGYQIVLWDVLSGDFDMNRSAASCLKNLKKNTRNGSIIVFHDSEKCYEKLKIILPEYLFYLKTNGWNSQVIV